MMGIFDRFKKKDRAIGDEEIGEGLPDMNAQESSLAEAVKEARHNPKEFRAREKAATVAAENEGLPSVNRRQGSNKMVTALGFIFIIGAAAALVVAVNGDKEPKAKKSVQGADEQVSNNLPPLAIPAPPPPIQLATSATPPVLVTQSGAHPIPLQGGAKPRVMANGKPQPDWTDRKMFGALLVESKANGGANTVPARPVAADADSNQPAVFAGQAGSRQNTNNALSAKLEPTITQGASASMLPNRNYLITKGTSLDCVLETALDSTVPGLTTCRLTRDVYSDNGQVLLLDRGSQLVGEYQGGIKQGQVRLFVLWTRAKTPNGVHISLNSPGTDALGDQATKGG
jgi:type IV secretion system protein VirB10